MRLTGSAVLAAFGLASIAGCSNDTPNYTSDAHAYQSELDELVLASVTRCKLREGDGALNLRFYEFTSLTVQGEARCITDCFRAGLRDCTDVSALLCDGQPSEELKACVELCLQTTSVPCSADFVGEVPLAKLCDGVEDCVTGADELGCFIRTGECDDGRRGATGSPSLACNGVADCSDGSDEYFCVDVVECEVGVRLSWTDRCDGERDCINGRDEEGCEPGDAPFSCGDFGNQRVTLAGSRRCDGHLDCLNGSDEEGCAPLACPAPGYFCDDGREIPWERFCDGSVDCAAGDDETPETCGRTRCRDGAGSFSEEQRCDGAIDCEDLTDELYCGTPYSCALGVRAELLCDGQDDCAESADEQPEACARAITIRECDDGAVAVRLRHICDGTFQCADRSDERGCDESDLHGDAFKCTDGMWIHTSLRCDGTRDCDDKSDERTCAGRMQCTDGASYPDAQRCDGKADCASGSDEALCPGRFRCNDGSSIATSQVCDGTDHCPDRSDEALCVFQCANGLPGGSAERCNGIVVCADASDEAGCPRPPTQYRCDDRTFIQIGKRCDLHGDCPDDSDETRCVTESILPCDGDPHVFYRAAERCDTVVHCPSGADELDCLPPAGAASTSGR